MNFYKTYYKTKFHNDKIQLELSKTNFTNYNYYNNIRKNNKNILYNNNKNAFSVDNKDKHSSKNIITNQMIKTINKLKPDKMSQNQIKKEYLRHFHTEAIKIKIRKNKKYKSLFDNINLSSPSESIFQSMRSNKKNQKRLINLKLKSNNKKIFTHILINDINTNKINTNNSEIAYREKNQKSESYMSDINLINKNKINNNFLNYKQSSNDISKTHFTTMYFSSGGNKSTEKSISSIHKNNITNINKNLIIEKNNENIGINYNNEKNNIINNIIPYDNNTKLKYNIYTNETIYNNNNRIPNMLTNNLNTSPNTIQSFITSLNYVQAPPYVVEFREQNLLNFYSKTRDLRYIKYFLFLKRNKLKKAKETKEFKSALYNMDTLKFINFYKLFKPYNYYLEKYLLFLKDEINIEYKENEKLKIKKNKLLSAVTEDRKELLKIHKRFNDNLNDKFFLLCVKNSTMNLELFKEEDKIEFEQDLRNFDILKNYINELSELDFNESLVGANKKLSYLKPKKLTKITPNNIRYNFNKKKITNINNKKEKTSFINIFNNSRLRYKQKPIFESVSEFNDYMKNSRNKIENLLMEDNKIGIEVANLRDYVILNQEDINKAKYNRLLFDNEYNKTKQELSDVKLYNSKLNIYKNNLLKNKKMKINRKIAKKIIEIINGIFIEDNKTLNSIINKKNIDKPILALKELEKVIIFLINFKNNQKTEHKKEYNETVKKIEKNKRLLIIKQRKEEDENRIENKVKKLIEKDMKILNINNRRINYKYKPSPCKKIKKEENSYKEKDDLDISY